MSNSIQRIHKKARHKAGAVREFLSKDAKYSTDYVITYLWKSQIKKSYEITS
nr:MAG TPA: hypothetical protein [Caudoviricetes sp.]